MELGEGDSKDFEMILNLLIHSQPIGLLKSHGQDISRRGKSKNLMIILPSHFAFQKGTEGNIGYFEKLESSTPELVIETEIV
jgi:tRNA pseudouridine-54 N-methylase